MHEPIPSCGRGHETTGEINRTLIPQGGTAMHNIGASKQRRLWRLKIILAFCGSGVNLTSESLPNYAEIGIESSAEFLGNGKGLSGCG